MIRRETRKDEIRLTRERTRIKEPSIVYPTIDPLLRRCQLTARTCLGLTEPEILRHLDPGHEPHHYQVSTVEVDCSTYARFFVGSVRESVKHGRVASGWDLLRRVRLGVQVRARCQDRVCVLDRMGGGWKFGGADRRSNSKEAMLLDRVGGEAAREW
jgi:hypothetical protein